MAKGVADVLTLYLEAPEPYEAPEPHGGAPGDRPFESSERLAIPSEMRGVVEPFLLWNLKVALESLGRTSVLRVDAAPRDGSALLLQHSSEIGTRRARRQLETWAPSLRVEVVVYGEDAGNESDTWVERLAEHAPPRRGPVVHRGGIETGCAFARALLRRQAIAHAAPGDPLRSQFLSVAGRLLRPDTVLV